MMKRLANDWVAGDLLKVTREHYFAKGDPEGVWPEIFLRKETTKTVEDTPSEIPIGTVIMALDAKPSSGQPAFVRVLYNDGVWVANSNYIMREPCTTVKPEKYLL